MPITQEKMLTQVQEARAMHRALIALRDGLMSYCANAKERYRGNTDLQEVLTTIALTVEHHHIPDDRETYINERHYSRRAKWNTKARRTQEQQRRAQGIPTMEEYLAWKKRENRDRRDLERSDPYFTEFVHPEGETTTFQSYNPIRERKASAPREPTRPAIIFPRDHPDDKPLEFETLDELPKPADTNLTAAPSFSLDEPEDKY